MCIHSLMKTIEIKKQPEAMWAQWNEFQWQYYCKLIAKYISLKSINRYWNGNLHIRLNRSRGVLIMHWKMVMRDDALKHGKNFFASTVYSSLMVKVLSRQFSKHFMKTFLSHENIVHHLTKIDCSENIWLFTFSQCFCHSLNAIATENLGCHHDLHLTIWRKNNLLHG